MRKSVLLLFVCSVALAAPTKVANFAGTIIRPTALTGTVNDWAPTGLSDATTIEVGTSGTTSLDGLTGGAEGRELELCNTGAFAMTLVNEAAGSTAANRFLLAGAVDWVLGSTGNSCARFTYSAGSVNRWKMVSKTGTTYPSLSVTGTLGVTGVTTTTGGLVNPSVWERTGVTSPTGLTGTLNDYNPTGLLTNSRVRATTSGTTTITGFAAGVDGQEFEFCSIGTGFVINLSYDSASSTAANRLFTLGGVNAVMDSSGNACVSFRYDGTSTHWREVSAVTNRQSGTTYVGTQAYTGLTIATSGSTKISDQGTAETLSSCGTSPTVVSSGRYSGVVTEGSVATGCTITVPAFSSSNPSCVVTSRSGLIFTYTTTTTTIVITNVGALSSTTLDYICVDH